MKKIITLITFLSVFISLSQTKELDSLTIQLAFQNADTTKVNTSVRLIKALYNEKDYDRALKYITQTERLSNSLKFNIGIAEITYYKALIYAEKDDYINAIDSYSISKALFAQLQDTLGIAKVNNRIGLIEIDRGNYNKGLQYSLSAIKELEKRDLKQDLRSAYSNLAKAYTKINAHDKAIEFNLKTLQVQEQLKDTEGIITSNNNLAKLYSIKKEHRKAIEYYEKVLTSIGTGNDSIRGEILPKLGGEYLQFKDYPKATGYLIQGLLLNRKIKNDYGLLISLNNLGNLNLQERRLQTAEKQLLQAGVIAKKIGNNEELLTNYHLMKTLDSTKRNFARAFVWQREYYTLKQSIDKNTKIVNLEDVSSIEFEANLDEQMSSSIVLGTETNVEDQKKIDQLQLIFYILLGAFVIVLTFLLLIYLKRSSSIKYTRDLEEKNKKIELQNEAILEQTKHLEDINKVKDKLFSIVSHDLKDSLTSIKGFVDLLNDGDISSEEFDKLIPELSENANNASMLLFNLLNWSKSQMQSLDPSPSLFNIQEIFVDKVNLLDQKIDRKGINLIDHSLKDFAYADRSMIEIVIQNLLSNAIKFCKAGDIITVSNHISNGNCIISVADTGVGIAEENIDKLFKSNTFTTIGTKNEKGTGLGLSICKELVELNKGQIWVESTLNVGSTFYVQLPKSKS